MIAYIRVSSVGGRDVESERYQTEDIQAEEIGRWAKAHGVEVVATFVDRDVSGAKDARPGFDGAMAALRAGRGEGIVVATLDRFSRQSTIDALKRVQEVQDAGGTIASVGGEVPVDPTTPAGEFQLTVFSAIARMQWREYDRRWRVAKDRAAARGAHLARAPHGYLHGPDGRLERGPMAPWITKMFEVAAEEGPRAARKYIESMDTDAPATRWTLQNVRRTLARRVYLGELAWNGTGTIYDAHEPLTDLATWTRAQSDPAFTRSQNAKYPLSGGPARCGGCSSELVGSLTKGGGRRAYRCATSGGRLKKVECPARAWVYADELEDWIRKLLVIEAEARESDPASYPEILPDRPTSDDVEEAEKILLERRARRDEFAVVELDLSPEAWGARAKALDDAVIEAEMSYEAAVLTAGPQQVTPRSAEIAEAPVEDLARFLGMLDLEAHVSPGRGPVQERASLRAR